MSDEEITIIEALQSGKAVATFTQGHSMRPLLQTGKTHVVIEPTQRKLTVGDLPFFRRKNGSYVIHRIIEVTDDGYRTRGDNCVDDEWVSVDQILGVVTEIYRNGKNVSVNDPGYRRYVSLLQATTFVRLPLFRLRAKTQRARRHLGHLRHHRLSS